MTEPKPSRLFQLPSTPLARVLVVDDYREVVELIGRYLDGRGYEVARAYDGRQALASALFFRPQVIVLNLAMPVMNGFQAMKFLRLRPSTKDIKIVMTSGYDYHMSRSLCAGADAFLEKPFALHTLDDTIKRLLTEPR